jgi:20S proteasome alpha/beta subunit
MLRRFSRSRLSQGESFALSMSFDAISDWFSGHSGVRPYGVSLLIAGWDSHRGQSLYQVDPSGSYWAWKASAIGKNMVNAKTFLEKR